MNPKQRRGPRPVSGVATALEALTVADLADDAVEAHGIARAAFDLVHATTRAGGGIAGRWTDEHALAANTAQRLAREASEVWEVTD